MNLKDIDSLASPDVEKIRESKNVSLKDALRYEVMRCMHTLSFILALALILYLLHRFGVEIHF